GTGPFFFVFLWLSALRRSGFCDSAMHRAARVDRAMCEGRMTTEELVETLKLPGIEPVPSPPHSGKLRLMLLAHWQHIGSGGYESRAAPAAQRSACLPAGSLPTRLWLGGEEMAHP